MARVGISLGSNLGDRIAHLRDAVARLAPLRSSSHLLVSPVFETEPVDCPEGSEAFFNAVIEIETDLPPLDLLAATQAIEREMGRPEVRAVNAPRTIDLDLLYYDDLAMRSPGLELPHPRMFQRAFVLKPLAAIRPDFVPAGALDSLDDSGVTEVAETIAG
ncbi:MAG: 2-amino-4-hydroxy-6-hydroxymethyldihydropteridine diphosphokinase [Verrucomicrobiales bacterium]|nr:2-amino-4-hydroxy-6-hydroxymethyldihydropteridine diphosphokinase [Verrucomicrobiales bacterium]